MYRDMRVHVVVPAYNEREFVGNVIRTMPAYVDRVFVVDDGSTDDTAAVASASGDARVEVVRTGRNLGVGGATIAGYRRALAEDAQIIVKMDGDGQMPPDELPLLLDAIIDQRADYAKGNRFLRGAFIHRMPRRRIVGNVLLTFLTKLASGYWNVFDPQNGYTAIRAAALRLLPLDRISPWFFFENDMLVHLNILSLRVVDVPMSAVYGSEWSDLHIPQVILRFPPLLVRRFAFRVLEKYVIRDFSPIALFLAVGMIGLAFGIGFGAFLWIRSFITWQPTPTGSIMLSLLGIVLGFQLCLQAIVLDIQATPR